MDALNAMANWVSCTVMAAVAPVCLCPTHGVSLGPHLTYNPLASLSTSQQGLLMLQVVYVFSAMGYLFFPEDFVVEDEPRCATLFQCYLTTLNHGGFGLMIFSIGSF